MKYTYTSNIVLLFYFCIYTDSCIIVPIKIKNQILPCFINEIIFFFKTTHSYVIFLFNWNHQHNLTQQNQLRAKKLIPKTYTTIIWVTVHGHFFCVILWWQWTKYINGKLYHTDRQLADVLISKDFYFIAPVCRPTLL